MSAMETLALSLILLSALMHAMWNLLVKRSHDKVVFIWWMFASSWVLMTLLMVVFDCYPRITLRLLLTALFAAVCFVFYHWLGGYAYREGDLSLTYPLAQTSMLYVPLWGSLLLRESLSATGIGGIALIVCGAYSIQLRGVSAGDIFRPLTQFGNRSVQAALLAGFIYSIGSVIDKIGVDHYSACRFTYVLIFFMFLLMSLNILRPRYRGRLLLEWRRNPQLMLWAGPVILASILSFRLGLQLAPVSYAVPVRQASLPIGVLIGIFFLGESFGRIRLVATALILAGVVLVWHG